MSPEDVAHIRRQIEYKKEVVWDTMREIIGLEKELINNGVKL